MKFRCPNCNHRIDYQEPVAHSHDETVDSLTCPSCNSRVNLAPLIDDTYVTASGMRIGHFELRELVGEGAFGSVFRAYDSELERVVALKLPREGRLTTETTSDFYKEARAVSGITHPNVVQVFEIGTLENRPYIVSEFIDGISLTEWLRQNAPTARQAAEIIMKVCDAVAAAHAKDVIHRDIKPRNILMDKSGQPHVTDFGLAKRSNVTDVTVTQDGTVLGTVAYMSPEQARGAISEVDVKSDVYAIGVCLYEMLCGRRPFEATDSRTVLYQKTTADAQPASSINKAIPRDLDTICERALQMDPAERYATARDFGDDLNRYLNGYPIHARRVSNVERVRRWIGRNKLLSGVAFTALALLAGLIIVVRTASANSSNAVPVSISCELGGAELPKDVDIDWTFFPLGKTRLPDHVAARQVSSNNQSVKLDLDPGEYLVVTEVPGVGFHEVYRLVPEFSKSTGGNYNTNGFTREGETVVLPGVMIVPQAEATAGMVLIPGAEYTAGSNLPDGSPNPMSPITTFLLDDFYIETSEVTCEAYFDVMPQRPAIYRNDPSLPTGKYPVVGVNWYQATHYAEMQGRRLLTEIEFEYVATNNGTTDFPWVTGKPPVPRWELNPVDETTVDITPQTGIKGLFSNAAELTSSQLAPFGGATNSNLPDIHLQTMKDSVVYKGGPASKDKIRDEGNRKITDRAAVMSRHSSSDFLSFRCGRSRSPLRSPRDGS